MRIKRYRMFWKSHFPEDFPILRKLDLNQPKGRTGKAFGVRIFGKLREPNAASRDAGFSMVSYFGDTPFGVEVGTCGKSGLETRITTSPIWPAVEIETR